MQTRLICKKCGCVVGPRYVTALGFVWHEEHFLCAACNRPIGNTSFYQHQDNLYHSDCYITRFAPRCAYCGNVLTGRYLEDYWGTISCPKHSSEYPECRFCTRLVPPHQQEKSLVEDDVCRDCRAVAVESVTQARPLFDQVVKWLKDQGLLFNNMSLNLLLGNQEQFHKHVNNHIKGVIDKHTLGVTLLRSTGIVGSNLRTEITGVAILRSLPATLFQAVAAHELGHVWLAVHEVQGLADWSTEGFCELLAYCWLMHQGAKESRYFAICMEHSKDPVYGEGFRKVRSLAQTRGFSNLIQILHTKRRLPT
jgi:hypothetical protein